jgi:hypothetical protein
VDEAGRNRKKFGDVKGKSDEKGKNVSGDRMKKLSTE